MDASTGPLQSPVPRTACWTPAASGCHDLLPLAARLAFVVATLGVAGLSFSYLESPIRHSRALARSSYLSFLVAGVIVGVSLVVVTLLGQ